MMDSVVDTYADESRVSGGKSVMFGGPGKTEDILKGIDDEPKDEDDFSM